MLTAVEQEGRASQSVIAAIRLLILTGARLSEILTLRWEFVDFERNVLRLPESKTGAKTIYLNPPAVELLFELPRIEAPLKLPTPVPATVVMVPLMSILRMRWLL